MHIYLNNNHGIQFEPFSIFIRPGEEYYLHGTYNEFPFYLKFYNCSVNTNINTFNVDLLINNNSYKTFSLVRTSNTNNIDSIMDDVLKILNSNIKNEDKNKISLFENALKKVFTKNGKSPTYAYYDANNETCKLRILLTNTDTMEYNVYKLYGERIVFSDSFNGNFDNLISFVQKDIKNKVKIRERNQEKAQKKKEKQLSDFKNKIKNGETTTINIIKRALLEKQIEFKEKGVNSIRLKNQFCEFFITVYTPTNKSEIISLHVGNKYIPLPFSLSDPSNILINSIISCANYTNNSKLNEALMLPVDATE